MPAWLHRRIPLPLHDWPLVVLVLAFLLPGLIGHDPWKTEDAVSFGIVHQMLSTGDWLTLKLAGEPFVEDGPIYFWVAALLAKALGSVLPPHEGARFASALFLILALWFVRLAARELYGRVQGELSMIALMGCLGLMWHAHETVPETAMLAGLAAAYYGIAISHKKPFKAALAFGVGCGVTFLSKGLFAVLQPLIAALLVLPFSAEFRKRDFGFAVALGLLTLIPFAVIWPWLVAQHAPSYFDEWWAWQIANVTHRPKLEEFVYYLKTLAWAAWPVWPLTLWALWAYRRYLRDPGYAVPFVAGLVTLVLLLFVGSPSEMDALALLVPLAIPAGSAAVSLRRGAANALAWFSIMTFTLIAAFMWVMWLATLTGFPARLAATAARLETGFILQVNALPLVFALALTAGWAVLVLRSERSTLRGLTHWAAGTTLIWGLAMTLWLAWIDYGKSYQPVALALKAQLPERVACIESRGLGETQRAVFHYHAGIVTRRAEVHNATQCPYLLVQTSTREQARSPGPRWKQVWEGSRPRDRERYRLYRRT